MSPLLSVDEVSRRTGTRPRLLRQWCATGRLRCERAVARDWLIAESDLAIVLVLGRAHGALVADHREIALLVPGQRAGIGLAERLERALGLDPGSVFTSPLVMDGDEYVVATWPAGSEIGTDASVAKIVETLGGDLLDIGATSAPAEVAGRARARPSASAPPVARPR